MAPPAGNKKDATEAETFSFETVACLLAVMEKHGIVLGMKHYSVMAKLDGKRTDHSFSHQFRKVKARAKELQDELEDAESPKKAKTGNSKMSTAKKHTPSNSKKRVRDASAVADRAEPTEVTPSKKVKEEKATIESQNESENLDEGENQYEAEVKSEPVDCSNLSAHFDEAFLS